MGSKSSVQTCCWISEHSREPSSIKFPVVGGRQGLFSWPLRSWPRILIVFSNSPFWTPRTLTVWKSLRTLLYESGGEMHLWGRSVFYHPSLGHETSGDIVPDSYIISKQVVLNLCWLTRPFEDLMKTVRSLTNAHIFGRLCTDTQKHMYSEPDWFWEHTHTPRLTIFLWVNEHPISDDQIVQ